MHHRGGKGGGAQSEPGTKTLASAVPVPMFASLWHQAGLAQSAG